MDIKQSLQCLTNLLKSQLNLIAFSVTKYVNLNDVHTELPLMYSWGYINILKGETPPPGRLKPQGIKRTL